jgi:eukaryotic-like serine/threonine-protein kinase
VIGQLVDGHEIVRTLGTGGMGEVYLARSVATGALRALKVVRTDRDTGPQATGRFRREVLALGRLRHPGIVQMLDAGRLASGAFYYNMEYVAGLDLQAAVEARGPFPVVDALTVLARIASALAFAHAQGVIHRDLKPANVLLADGEPSGAKIIDFGLAKLAAEEGLTRLTDDQQVLGSPLYWAPEQSSTAAVGPPADVYALAGLAYFALSGTPVFTARPAVIMVYAHLHEPPQRLSARCPDLDIPRSLDDLILACAAKKPEQRPTAAHVAAELEALLASPAMQAAHEIASSRTRTKRPSDLFASVSGSDLRQALTAQIRQVVIELAHATGAPTREVDDIQSELENHELDLAMLDADSSPSPRLADVRAIVERMHATLETAFRALTDVVLARRKQAPADTSALYVELDGLFARYRTL